MLDTIYCSNGVSNNMSITHTFLIKLFTEKANGYGRLMQSQFHLWACCLEGCFEELKVYTLILKRLILRRKTSANLSTDDQLNTIGSTNDSFSGHKCQPCRFIYLTRSLQYSYTLKHCADYRYRCTIIKYTL